MKTFTTKDFEQADKAFRINLINSLTGVKGAHLLGSKSAKGVCNLGLFSNVVHIGASPALIGIVFRPSADHPANVTNVPRHSLQNILHTNEFTLNHISSEMMPNAHLASAKFEEHIDEFTVCQLTPEYIPGFHAPFVQESPLKIALKYKELIPIKSNGTQLLVAEVVAVHINEPAIAKNGRIDFEKLATLASSGLNTYYATKKQKEYPYARNSHNLSDYCKLD